MNEFDYNSFFSTKETSNEDFYKANALASYITLNIMFGIIMLVWCGYVFSSCI